MKSLTEQPEYFYHNKSKVCVLSWFNSLEVQDIYNKQKQVFNHFKININHYYDSKLTHAKFMDYALSNFEADIYIFFDLDCIPLNSGLIERIVLKLQTSDGILGIEQSANHLDSNYIYAGPACFAITKTVYNIFNCLSFEGTHRSDVAQEYSYVSDEKGIEKSFFELYTSKNKKWRLGKERFFGNGCVYRLDQNLIYHQFQTNLEEQRSDFINECNKILN